MSVYDLDLVSDTYAEVNSVDRRLAEMIGESGVGIQDMMNRVLINVADEAYLDNVIEFSNLSTLNERMSEENTVTLEYPDKEKKWRRGRFIVSERDRDRRILHALWIVEDIDSEKKARDKLFAVAERLNDRMSSIANIYMSVYDFDLTNDTFSGVKADNVQVNDIVGNKTGNSQQILYDVMDHMADESSKEAVHKFVNLGTVDERLEGSDTITIEYLSSDKKWRRGRFVASDRTVEGIVRHVLWMVEDIDKEKKDREELIDMSERAIAASEAKSAFLSNMSHEIRTPINAVLGMNEMVLRECSDENILQYSESIRTAGTTLLGIINDILDFSKIEAGKMEIIPVDYDLASVLNDLINMTQTRAEPKGLMIIPDFDRSAPHFLYGDEVRIKQVITNILTNAVKYTEKGSVTFKMGYERVPDDSESVILKFSVKDTGIGIKKEDMKKLFSEFERIEEERNRSVEGTGLGMSITQSLLGMMNSSLHVESVYGEGSEFSFELKQKVRKWDAIGDYEAAFRHAVSTRKKYHEKFTAPEALVLVVDDTPMNLLVFKGLLKQTGVRIDTAESGDEGIALVRKNKYDMIFLDHMMPNKDGIETLKEIKAIEGNPNHDVPMICLTANAISGAREQYLSAGFDDYLTKPIDSSKLEEMMYEYLPDSKIKTSSTAGEQDKKAKKKLPDFIFEITELDAVTGLSQMGSEDMYIKALSSFSLMIEKHIEDTRKYWKAGDMANTAIKLHTLSSSASMIGAQWISRLASDLKEACRQNDRRAVGKQLEALLYRCKWLGQELLPLTEEEQERQ